VVTEALLRLYIVPFEGRWPSRVHLVYTAESSDLIIGDSHLYRAFATHDGFANLSRGGTSPAALEILVAEYFRHRRPGRVIVEAGPQLMRQKTEDWGTQGHERYFGQNRFGLGFALYVFEPGVTARLAWLLHIPRIVAQSEFERVRKIPGNQMDTRLSRLMVERSPREALAFTQRVIDLSRPVSGVRASNSYAAYRRMLALLQQRGAQMCMITVPESPDFVELAAKDSRYIEGSLALHELATEFGLRYVDSRDLDLSFDATAFVDADHMTARSAETFAPIAIRACFGED
jgi:hypothetical protein